jgi:hypothetical protein
MIEKFRKLLFVILITYVIGYGLSYFLILSLHGNIIFWPAIVFSFTLLMLIYRKVCKRLHL